MNFKDQQDQFIKFIESYKVYKKPVHVIAENKDDESILNFKKNRNTFEMFSLDNICKTRMIFWEDNLQFTPKTTDALWYKPVGDSFFIYLFEFKGDRLCNHSTKCRFRSYLCDLEEQLEYANSFEKKDIKNIINRIKPLYKKYSDSMLNGLIMKPLETITTSLPLIYEDYYERNKDVEGVKYIDMVDFLRKSQILYFVVALPDSDNNYRDRSEVKRCANAVPDACLKVVNEEDDIEITESYRNNLKSYYKRYERANIIKKAEFINVREFNNFVKDTFGTS